MIKRFNETPYASEIKQLHKDHQELIKLINSVTGVKESDTGLSPPFMWNLNKDKMTIMRNLNDLCPSH